MNAVPDDDSTMALANLDARLSATRAAIAASPLGRYAAGRDRARETLARDAELAGGQS